MNPESSKAKGRVLVVDDDDEMRTLIEMVLRVSGYVVEGCPWPEDAIVAAQANPPDIVITDLNMPGMDGVALLVKLRGREPELPVIVVTASGELSSAVAAMRAGAEDYLTKPIDLEALRFSVERAIERRRARAETDILRRTLEELRAAHVALQEERDFVDAVLDTIGALVLVLDLEGTIMRFNCACEETTGFSASEIVGQPVFKLICPEELEGVHKVFDKLVEADIVGRHENHWLTKDGKRRLIAWSNTVLKGEDGKVRNIIATGIDVTETRELAARMRRSEHLASLATVSAGVAHEIRNPLNAASLHLTLLRRLLTSRAGPDVNGALEAAAVTEGEIKRVSALLEEFLLFAKPKPLRCVKADLRKIADEVTSLCRIEAGDAGIELVCDGELELEVTIDEYRMRQVLLNLVRNALEAVGRGGRVSLLVEKNHTAALIRVEDNGPGLGDHGDRIFEPFFTTKEKGTGLGLAITHRIVVDHGGDITVKSRPGSTVFQICLPLSPSPLEGSSPHARP